MTRNISLVYVFHSDVIDSVAGISDRELGVESSVGMTLANGKQEAKMKVTSKTVTIFLIFN